MVFNFYNRARNHEVFSGAMMNCFDIFLFGINPCFDDF